MRKITKALVSTGVAVALMGTGVSAANAWGTLPDYCSPSIGCIGQYNGKNIYAPTPYLSAYERQKMLECNLVLAGALVGATTRDWRAVGSAIFGAGAGLAGPCADFWNSTKRFR